MSEAIVGAEIPKNSKNEKKNSELSEDELKKRISEIQKITDKNIEHIEKILETKKIDLLFLFLK